MTMFLRPFTWRAIWRLTIFAVMFAVTWIIFGKTYALMVGMALNCVSIEMLYKQFRDLPRYVEQLREGVKDQSDGTL